MSDAAFLDRVADAERAIRQLFPETPLQLNEHLSARYGARVYLKREDLTPVRSYKLRGAFNFMRKRLEEGSATGAFTCASAGNHAQGFAFACRHFGFKGRVFMPVTTPQQKIQKTRIFGAGAVEIELVGDYFDDCYAAAKAYAASSGAAMVPPFDHEDIIEGQATVGREIEMELGAKPDMLVLPVGGGGLASGVTRYFLAKGGEMPDIRLVEPLGAPSLHTSLVRGELTRLPQMEGFVDGAAVAEIGALPFETLRRFSPDKVVLSPEGRLCKTMLEMLNLEGIVLEPAGALAIDALNALGEEVRGKTVALVVSGSNFDFERLPDVKERALRFEGLKKYFILRLAQRPGALRDFLGLLGPDDDIARFEYLKKSARDFGSILLGIETKDTASFPALFERFEANGIAYQDITENRIMADLLI
ncbi:MULTISPECIES: threonine ammonia-lyase IlvA [unclassified Aureimonas]|uniref:threonine ammonia-lyase IlvA n=1 Tax=unclassified Aureimonas TaxID=2615206 RepID=UPI0006FC1982|nr:MULTISPECIES: threonine ammonia-lyase IlvA [unclassified Aureimonas]KQT60563.1 threonine dehydratase [Aureimonas sp. Leaf427]KQT79440.1 threonine dehydratase [Aureimonas sp. Leaf460]